MDSDLEKKRLDKLARVRENQRKSRARKQDHIRDLEQKVLDLQKEANRRDVEHRLAVQKLEAENHKLRYLVSCSGVSTDALEAYLQSIDKSVAAQKVAIPALRRPVAWTQPRGDQSKCTGPSSNNAACSVTSASDEKSSCVGEEFHTDSEKLQKLEITSFCACLPDQGSESLPISEQILNTTVCAIAEKLVYQYNTRGLDISEIQQKLRAGFSRSLSEEGCRVQNQILFQVLDEISSD